MAEIEVPKNGFTFSLTAFRWCGWIEFFNQGAKMKRRSVLGLYGRRGAVPVVAAGAAVMLLASGAWACVTHSGEGNHHWLVVGDGHPAPGNDPSGGGPAALLWTGDAKFDNTSPTLVPTGAKVTSYLDMKTAYDSAGGKWELKYSRSGVPTGNFCGENTIGVDELVTELVPAFAGSPPAKTSETNPNGGTPWGADITPPGDPSAGEGFLWEVVWGVTPDGTGIGNAAAGPPTSAGAYETCVIGSSSLVLQAETIIYFDVV